MGFEHVMQVKHASWKSVFLKSITSPRSASPQRAQVGRSVVPRIMDLGRLLWAAARGAGARKEADAGDAAAGLAGTCRTAGAAPLGWASGDMLFIDPFTNTL
jgi:hypothetical protein